MARSSHRERGVIVLLSASEFQFARLRYDSGDWDYNPKDGLRANVLDAILQYTSIPVSQQEIVITADSAELQAFPLLCS